MDIAYLQGRLQASLAQVKAAVDPCARIAHEGLARGYRSILANYGYADAQSQDPANDRSRLPPADRELDTAIGRWINEGGGAGRGREA